MRIVPVLTGLGAVGLLWSGALAAPAQERPPQKAPRHSHRFVTVETPEGAKFGAFPDGLPDEKVTYAAFYVRTKADGAPLNVSFDCIRRGSSFLGKGSSRPPTSTASCSRTPGPTSVAGGPSPWRASA
jgi:hypothetical protein